MKLRALVSGVYNDLNNQAEKRVAGDIFVTRMSYGQSLIDDGYAEVWIEHTYAGPVPSEAVGPSQGQPVGLLTSVDVFRTISPRLPDMLKKKGFYFIYQVEEAADVDLLAVQGVGAKTVAKMRALLERRKEK